MAKLIITIDGPAASGKSTMAKLLAQKIGATFLDTGSMYRAFTLAAINSDADMENEKELLDKLEKKVFSFIAKKDRMTVLIDGADVTDQIRNPEITANSKHIASKEKFREKLVKMQRDFAANYEKIVTEGRDQGTVAFPNANIKFFLTADKNQRAKRRYNELQAQGNIEKLNETLKAIEKRDTSDTNREVGPLKPAEDAIIIDTTHLTIEEVLKKMLDYVNERCV